MTTIWIVGMGEYSDQYNVCACPTEALAEQIAAALGAWVNEVEFYDTMPEIVDRMQLQAIVTAEGEQRQSTLKSWRSDDPTRSPITEPWEDHELSIADPSSAEQVPCRHDVHGVRDYRGEWSVEVTVSGIDHVRVRKVFSEQMAIAKADAAIIIEAGRLKATARP